MVTYIISISEETDPGNKYHQTLKMGSIKLVEYTTTA